MWISDFCECIYIEKLSKALLCVKISPPPGEAYIYIKTMLDGRQHITSPDEPRTTNESPHRLSSYWTDHHNHAAHRPKHLGHSNPAIEYVPATAPPLTATRGARALVAFICGFLIHKQSSSKSIVM